MHSRCAIGKEDSAKSGERRRDQESSGGFVQGGNNAREYVGGRLAAGIAAGDAVSSTEVDIEGNPDAALRVSRFAKVAGKQPIAGHHLTSAHPDKFTTVVEFLTDIERLKLVERKAYLSDKSRRENSAEHSWHLALGLLVLAQELNLKIDLHKALIMALIHDVCEVDAGDTPAFGPQRPDQHEAELRCIERLAGYDLKFAPSIRELWLEYEAQESIESRWVKVMDRVMPFIIHFSNEGLAWKEQTVSRSRLKRVCEPVREHAPEIYEWMHGKMEDAVRAGWLIDA